jgi:hypothetical protein
MMISDTSTVNISWIYNVMQEFTLYVYPTQWKIWTLIIIMHQYMTNRFTGFQIKCKLCIGNDWQLNIILLRYFFELEPVHSEVYSIQHYMIKFVNGFGQVGGFIW